MKITFDTADIDDNDALGALLALFLTQNGGHPSRGRDMDAPGWSRVADTPRPLKVALMGDAVYEGFEPTHIRHDATDLEALWYADGDLSLMFHQPGDDGFTIVNSHNGLGAHWREDDLEDPRNDPAYDPYAGTSFARAG